jgi:NAD(P)H dehydrogenase (quinone)
MTIAVTGTTGQLGRLAIAALKNRLPAEKLIALARSPEKASDLGINVRMADYRKPETLSTALEGVDVLVLISSSDFDDRAGQHSNVINAAEKAGVGRLIYTSILKGDRSPMLLAADHVETEAAIRGSGLRATILRNGWYTENYTATLGGSVEAGAMIGSAADAKLSTATRADYAEAITSVASEDGHEGKIYELAGDKAFTMDEMAAEVSAIAGKSIPYTSMPKGNYAEILESFGLPAGFAMAVADADACAVDGALFDDSGTLSRLIGRPTTPMAQSVANALA